MNDGEVKNELICEVIDIWEKHDQGLALGRLWMLDELVAELNKDKARLDWLLKNCLIKELDLGWVHDSRETIDEAMDV